MTEFEQLQEFMRERIAMWKTAMSAYPLNEPIRNVYDTQIAALELVLEHARVIHRAQARSFWDKLVKEKLFGFRLKNLA
jgi:hypothetical protein